MVKYFLLASTIISGALALSLPASAVTIGAEAAKFDPAVVGSTSVDSPLLIQVADDDNQGDDNDDNQGDDNDDDQGDDEQ
jgi:hypothetical protein